MSLDGAYEHDNIFAKILRGEIPSARVFEDEHVFAFMDAFPQARGHTLVIPKHSHARNLLEEEPQVLTELILGVQRVARAVRAALNPDGLSIMQYNGTPAGQTAPKWELTARRAASRPAIDLDPVDVCAGGRRRVLQRSRP